MDPNGLTAIGMVAAIIGLGLWNGYKEYREYRMRKRMDILPNPQRCEDHEQRIRTMERCMAEAGVHFQTIKQDISEIKDMIHDLNR